MGQLQRTSRAQAARDAIRTPAHTRIYHYLISQCLRNGVIGMWPSPSKVIP